MSFCHCSKRDASVGTKDEDSNPVESCGVASAIVLNYGVDVVVIG